MFKDWQGFIELIKNKWIKNRLSYIRNVAAPLSVYTDSMDVPIRELSINERERYIETTKICLGAYLQLAEINEGVLNNEKIVVNGISFTAVDELFNYFEEVFVKAIKVYEDIFKQGSIEAWKLEFGTIVLEALGKSKNIMMDTKPAQ